MASQTRRLNHVTMTRLFRVLKLASDFSMAALAYVLAYFTRRAIPFPGPAADYLGDLSFYLPTLLIHGMSVVAVCYFNRLYEYQHSRIDEMYRVSGAVTIATLMGQALTSLIRRDLPPGGNYSRMLLLYAWLYSIGLIVTVRWLLHGLRKTLVRLGWGRRRIVIIGLNDIGRSIVQKILWDPTLGYEAAGMVSEHDVETTQIQGVPVLGTVKNLEQVLDQQDMDEIIIALPEDTDRRELLWLIAKCERWHVPIRLYPDLFQLMTDRLTITELGGLPLLSLRELSMRGWKRAAKRAMDIVGASVGLILLSPFLLMIAILIKLDSPGPVFYVQERMGLDARPFWMIKFRSMRVEASSQHGWTVPNDPRRTRIGAWLRKYNLDELPQLINVLIGDMSLVGPRPEQPYYVEQFRRSIPRYMERHREKAGMTGWAQVNGLRGDTSIAERTKYDLWYIENWSLLLDIKILIRTFINLFRSPNAY